MLANLKIILLFFCFISTAPKGCDDVKKKTTGTSDTEEQSIPVVEAPVEEEMIVQPIAPGAYNWEAYQAILQDKKIAMVVNQTSMIGEKHLVDFLLEKGVQIEKIFAPEHGFRGEADAGEQIKDGKDGRTGISLISLYGKKKKPVKSDLQGIDLIVFDIQDVGARFYTYISSMHYVMEACAENDIEFLVLDRPNPNGHYVDGPILEAAYRSFVGMHEIPIVHGMTIAEYARMINGEKWLANGVECKLQYVLCENYNHDLIYDLKIKPSPNLPNLRSIYLYPSLCLFEGTTVNIGRGTDKQFQIYGHPDFRNGNYEYIPKSMPGAKYPKFENETCYGFDYSQMPLKIARKRQFDLNYLVDYYEAFPNKSKFFLKNNFFDKLAGNRKLRKQIESGMTVKEIRATWADGLDNFRKTREKYLLYD